VIPIISTSSRIKLDGSGLELLTPEDADHTVADMLVGTPSAYRHAFRRPDVIFGRYLFRMDLPPITVLRDAAGRLVSELEKSDLSLYSPPGWKWP